MDIFTPTPGVIYKLTFVDGYTYYDGAYKVVKIMSFDEYVDDGHDILQEFYVPAVAYRTATTSKIDMTVVNNIFLTDQTEVRKSKILKLIPPESSSKDSDGVFVPMYYLKETPDFNIKKYQKYGLVIYIGVTDKLSLLEFVRNNITDSIAASTGITPLQLNPQFVSVGEDWLTDEEYQSIVTERSANAKKYESYYTENVRLNKKISELKSTIEAYEGLVKQLNNSIDKSAQKISDYMTTVAELNNTIEELTNGGD